MQVKLTVGKAGSGKTYASVSEFTEYIKKQCGAFSNEHCYFIVPEQFCVETESKILSREGMNGFIGGEVISFNRLCLRILGELGIEGGEPLSASGRAMVLTDILIKNSKNLEYFKEAGNRPQMCGKLLETLTECRKYSVFPETLKKLAENADGDLEKAKVGEIAFILEKYNELFENGLFDVQLFYERIAKLVEEGKTTISESFIWVDSFSGFTENEMILMTAFAKKAKKFSLALSRNTENALAYGCPNATYNYVRAYFAKNGIEFAEENVDNDPYSRFDGNETFKYIADNFCLPGAKRAAFDANQSISVISADCFYDEVRCMAENIVKLVRDGMDFSDIAAVLPNVDEAGFIIEAEFSKRNIPFFIDAKTEISGHPAIRLVYGFLNIISDDMCISDCMGILKTGLFLPGIYSKDRADNIENTLLRYGVRNKASWEKMLRFMDKNGIDKSLFGRFYDFFYAENGFCRKAADMRTVNDVLNLVLDFSGAIGLEKNLNNMSGLGGEPFIKVWNAFVRILSECSEIMGETKINGYKKLTKYTNELIMNAVSMFRLGAIPSSHSCVQIGNAARSRYADKKVVFVLGANEGLFPAAATDNGFIDDRLRKKLGDLGASLGYDSDSRVMLNIFNVFSVLTAPSEKLFISYSTEDSDGGELVPSDVISKLCGKYGLFGIDEVKYAATKTNSQENVQENVTVSIGEELSKKLLDFESVLKTSISRILEYYRCPYGFFIRNVVALKERDKLNIENYDAGTFFHAMIEKGIKAAENKDFAELDDVFWKKAIEDAVNAYFSDPDNAKEAYLRDFSNKNAFIVDRITEYAEYDAKRISEYSKASGFKPVFEELEFGKKDSLLPPVSVDCGRFSASINGKIDRVDVRNSDGRTEAGIVDYKSGGKDNNDVSLENGTWMQPLIYKTALENGFNKELAEKIGKDPFVGSIAFYMYAKIVLPNADQKHKYVGFSDSEKSIGEPYGNKIKPTDLKELETANIERIKESLNGMVSGEFTPLKRKGADVCSYCSQKNKCKVKNIGKETDTDEN